MKLLDVGRWDNNSNRNLTFSPHSQPKPEDNWTITGKENWRKVAKTLRELKCEWLYEGKKTLLSTRTDR